MQNGKAVARVRAGLAGVLTLCLAAGCARSGDFERGDSTATGEPSGAPGALAEVLEADREFARAVAERGIEAWVDAFDDDGAMIVPAGPIATGPEAVRAAMEPAFDEPGFSFVWEPLGGAVSGTGDLAFTFGDYETRMESAVIARGRYVTVWKRGSDGRWRVLADIGNRAHG